MAINVGQAVATLDLDTSRFDKGIMAAADAYMAFINDSDRLVGFNANAKALEQLTRMVSDLGKLEGYNAAQQIAAYESIAHLYENNANQQMQLALKVSGLKKQLLKEEYDTAMETVKGMFTGDAMTTDYAAILAEYEKLLEAWQGDAERVEAIEEKMAQTAQARLDKVTEQTKKAVDTRQAESRRAYEAEKVLYEDTTSLTVAFYQAQITLGREAIDQLEGQQEALTKAQRAELEKRLSEEADYQGKIKMLLNQAAADRQKALDKAVEATIKANDAIAEAQMEAEAKRAKAEADYLARRATLTGRQDAEALRLLETYEKQVANVYAKLEKDEQQLNDAFQKSLNTRKNALMNFTGFFEGFQQKDVAGEELLENLQSQVEAMTAWREAMAALKERGMGEELYSALEAMGISRLNEVAALGRLTDEELAQYEALYKEKNRIAMEEAERQLSAQRDMLEKDIEALRQEAENSLDALAAGYAKAMAQVDADTKAALTKLTQSYNQTLSDIDAALNKEIAAQEAALNKSLNNKAAMFQREATLQNQAEQSKTANVRRESQLQEVQVAESAQNNVDTLWQSVPLWKEAGEAFGDNLLSGIQSTRYQIERYLDSVASAVRRAQEGESASIGYYAKGTNAAARGLAVVGEAGPEVVDFSGGEQVLSFQNSLQLVAQGVQTLSGAIQAVAGADVYRNLPAQGESLIDYDKLAKAIQGVLPDASKTSPATINYNPVYNSPKAASVAELQKQDRLNLRRFGLLV